MSKFIEIEKQKEKYYFNKSGFQFFFGGLYGAFALYFFRSVSLSKTTHQLWALFEASLISFCQLLFYFAGCVINTVLSISNSLPFTRQK